MNNIEALKYKRSGPTINTPVAALCTLIENKLGKFADQATCILLFASADVSFI